MLKLNIRGMSIFVTVLLLSACGESKKEEVNDSVSLEPVIEGTEIEEEVVDNLTDVEAFENQILAEISYKKENISVKSNTITTTEVEDDAVNSKFEISTSDTTTTKKSSTTNSNSSNITNTTISNNGNNSSTTQEGATEEKTEVKPAPSQPDTSTPTPPSPTPVPKPEPTPTPEPEQNLPGFPDAPEPEWGGGSDGIPEGEITPIPIPPAPTPEPEPSLPGFPDAPEPEWGGGSDGIPDSILTPTPKP